MIDPMNVSESTANVLAAIFLTSFIWLLLITWMLGQFKRTLRQARRNLRRSIEINKGWSRLWDKQNREKNLPEVDLGNN